MSCVFVYTPEMGADRRSRDSTPDAQGSLLTSSQEEDSTNTKGVFRGVLNYRTG